MDKLVEIGSITQQMVDTLCAAVHGKVSVVVSGGTCSGKTTLLNALSTLRSGKTSAVITIEDAAEFQLQQPPRGPTLDAVRQC